MSTSPGLRARIATVLDHRSPNNAIAESHYGQLLIEYAEASIGPPHLVEELETGDEGKTQSCIWEAMLYRLLRTQGYDVRGSAERNGQHGPDFRVEHEGRTIWIEAVVPGPQGIPATYLEPPAIGEETRVRRKPDRERVLRCTSVITDKQRKIDAYRGRPSPSDSG